MAQGANVFTSNNSHLSGNILHSTPSERGIFVAIMNNSKGTRKHTPRKVRKPKNQINPAFYRRRSFSSLPLL